LSSRVLGNRSSSCSYHIWHS